ncbi:MAG TPA: hypothetical protein VFN11_14255 [Ktedonobacterales bacterium]|nr:hypothetical protein [Ktedonobacterales bacterium]
MPEDPQASAGAPTGTPGQQPSDGAGTVPSPQSSEPEIANPEAKKYADEAARIRHDFKAAQKELAELRAFKQQQDDAKLSAEDLAQKTISELQAKLADVERAKQEIAVRAEVKGTAKELGLKQELALKLIDWSEITYDDAGDPTNIPALLQQAMETYGLAAIAVPAGSPAASAAISQNGANGSNGKVPARPQPTSVGSTPANPARSASNGAVIGGWTWEAISSLTKDQYEGLSPAQRAEMSRFISAHPKR